MEETYHDENDMCSMTVILHEIDFYKAMCDRAPADKDFYSAKAETLEYQKDNLETQIGNGLMTIDSYLAKVKRYLEKVQNLHARATKHLGPNDENTKRLATRIQQIQGEINEHENPPVEENSDDEEAEAEVGDEETTVKQVPDSGSLK